MSLHEHEKTPPDHIEYPHDDLNKAEASTWTPHHGQPCPINDGSFRSPYHYSNHEDVKYTHPRGIAYLALVILFAGSQTPLYFMGASLSFVVASVGGSAIDSWYVVAYTLSLAAVVPFTGYLADLISRRYVAILGQVFNCVGTILIATSHSPAQVITGSALTGMGAGIGEMSAQSGLGEMVPRKHRGNISALMIIGIIPFTPYVLWSQLLGSKGRWRDAFWISLAYNLLDLVILAFGYFPPNEPLPEGVTRKALLKEIDYLGGFLAIAGLTILLYAFQNGEAVSWTKAGVLAPFFVGLAVIAAFIYWQTKALLPLVPIELFKSNPRIMSLTFAITAIAGANFFSLTNFVPLLVATVFDASTPWRVGIRAFGVALTTTLGAVIFAPPLSSYPNHTKWIMLAATGLMTIFVGALAAVNPDREALFIVLSIIAGFGVGGCIVPAATIAIVAAPNDLIGTVASLTLSIRAIGGAIGNSVYFNVLDKKIVKSIPVQFPPRLAAAGLPLTSIAEFIPAYLSGNATLIGAVPGVTPAVIQAAAISMRWVYSDALKQVFLVSIAFGTVSVILAAFLQSLSQFTESNEGMDVHRHLQEHKKQHF